MYSAYSTIDTTRNTVSVIALAYASSAPHVVVSSVVSVVLGVVSVVLVVSCVAPGVVSVAPGVVSVVLVVSSVVLGVVSVVLVVSSVVLGVVSVVLVISSVVLGVVSVVSASILITFIVQHSKKITLLSHNAINAVVWHYEYKVFPLQARCGPEGTDYRA